MKIISKYKDYYDYLTGIYGVDPLLVLDRRVNNNSSVQLFGTSVIDVTFCNYSYHYIFNPETKEVFYGSDIKNFDGFIKERTRFFKRGGLIYDIEIKGRFTSPDKYSIYAQPTKIVRPKVPISISINRGTSINFPKLEDVCFNKIIPPKEAYIKLSEWLSSGKKDKTVDKQTDKEKILSHGFDYKKSFRKRQIK